MPAPEKAGEACDRYEDSLTGGQVFTMYCAYCHNAPTLAERPFSNYKNVAAHMRVRANLTGKEYAKLVEFLRRWHDVPPPAPPPAPSPKRFIYSPPILPRRKTRRSSRPVGAARPTPRSPDRRSAAQGHLLDSGRPFRDDGADRGH